MNGMCQKKIYPFTKNLLIACILLVTTFAKADETPVKGPDITGEYQFTPNIIWKTSTIDKSTVQFFNEDRAAIFFITKTGNGVHLEGEVSSKSTENQKKLIAKDIELLTGDFIWQDTKGAFKNITGKKTYLLYKVNDNTLALRDETGNSELGTFKKKEGSLGDLVGSMRNDVSGLIGSWRVEGTTANIELTSGVKNDLNIRYGTSVYELNKDDGGVFESYSGSARSSDDTISLQVVSDSRIKLDISGTAIYAIRGGNITTTVGVTTSRQQVSASTSSYEPSGSYGGTTGTLGDNDQSKLLFSAIKAGDGNALEELLSQGVNINAKNLTGRTALIESIYQSNFELMEQLLEANADVNLADNQGRTPLIIAIQKSSAGNSEMVATLLDRRPNITIQTIDESLKKDNTEFAKLLLDANANKGEMAKRAIEKGKTQLFDLMLNEYSLPLSNILFDTALNNRKFAIADKMIAKGFNAVYALDASVKQDAMDLVYTALENGGNANTALSYAVKKKEKELVKMTVEDYGADPNKVLPAAVAQKNLEIVGMLLANNADPNGQMSVVSASGDLQMLDIFITNGADPNLGVLPAAKANKNKAVQLLLQNGADANTLLEYAIENSNLNYVNQALQAGAQANDAKLMATAGARGNLQIVNALLEAGGSPNDAILPATKANKPAIVQELMNAGADGASAKLIAASAVHNNPTLTKMFLDAGANAQDGMFAALGASADKTLQFLITNGASVESHMLLTTVKQNSSSCSKILLEQGISANMKDAATGFSLLHYSAQNDNPVLTYALLENDAPVDARANGDTPLHLAVKNRKGIATVDALIAAGADVNALNGKGKSVLNIAKGNKIKKLLKQKGAKK